MRTESARADNGGVNEPIFVIPLWADLIAVGLGGIQGALFASGFRGQRRLDLLGVAIIGIVMGMGGGLIRDLLLNVTPVTLQSNWYLLTATRRGAVGMLLAGVFQRLNARHRRPRRPRHRPVRRVRHQQGARARAARRSRRVRRGVLGRRRRHPARHDHGLPVAIMHVGSLYAVAAGAGCLVARCVARVRRTAGGRRDRRGRRDHGDPRCSP